MGGSPCPIEIMKQVLTKLHMPQVTVSIECWVERQKTRYHIRPIKSNANKPMSQSELDVKRVTGAKRGKTCNRYQARENV